MTKKTILSIDFAAKTGWVVGEQTENGFKVLEKGKFKTKGNNEKEKVMSLMERTERLLHTLAYVDEVIFEDSISGSSATSLKTLRATFGKRYVLIGVIGKIIPNAKIYTVRPTAWHKMLPEEFRTSKVELTKAGKPTRAKGKEKKELVVNYVNQVYPELGLIWDNERVNCDNDIADAVCIAKLYCEGLLKDIERVG